MQTDEKHLSVGPDTICENTGAHADVWADT